jgi:hypothetical protein
MPYMAARRSSHPSEDFDRVAATRIVRHTTHECAAHYAAGKKTITRFSKSQENEVWYKRLNESAVAHKQGQRHAPSLLYVLERRRGVRLSSKRQELKTLISTHDLMID